MTVLLLSFTAVETTELALHEVSGETDPESVARQQNYSSMQTDVIDFTKETSPLSP